MPSRFDWTDEEVAEMLDHADAVERLLRGVGHDCMRDVLRARVRRVETRSPHSQYL